MGHYLNTYEEVIERKIIVHNWQFMMHDELWNCWAYYKDSDSAKEYLDWLKENMTGKYSATPKFNSGNPMIITTIKDEVDAALFKLTWVV
jgi:hypothetical protein